MVDGPRLVVKIIDAPRHPLGKVMALSAEDGHIVGKQAYCEVTCDADGTARVTASFHIDGEIIRFAD